MIMAAILFGLAPTAMAADEEACLDCHRHEGLKARAEGGTLQNFHVDRATFDGSVHGALPCRGCHTDIIKIPHEKKKRRVSCGLSCHGFTEGRASSHVELYNGHLETAHGKAIGRGPGCLTCHAHNERPDYAVDMREKTEALCRNCHSDQGRKSRPPSLAEHAPDGPSEPLVAEDIYHELSIISNFSDTPGCIDCHPAHEIYRGGDRRSSVHADNIEDTCAGAGSLDKGCHTVTEQYFTSGSIHDNAWIERSGQNAESGRLWLIAMLLIAPLGLHMVLSAIRSPRTAGREAQNEDEEPTRTFTRMTLHQRVLHAMLALLFIAASVGGLAMWRSDLPICAKLIGMAGGFEAMASIHLVTALALGALIVYHFVLLMFVAVKEDWIMDDLTLMPGRRDFRDLADNAKFMLFFSKAAPRFDRFAFTQKLDYFTALAGLCLMLAMGLAVGFPERSTALIPPAYLGELRAIHVVIGFLLIFFFGAWHVFNNFLAPGKLFSNWSWITGTISASQARRDYPELYDREMRQEREERLKKEKAVEERSMEKIISKQSKELKQYLDAGNEHARQENYDLAVEQYRKALDLLPNFPQARYNLAGVYQKSGDIVRAAAEYKRFIDMDPFNAMAEKVRSILREIEKSPDGTKSEADPPAKQDTPGEDPPDEAGDE
jgi:cytochrome b subunit of formate dehydrogenase